MMAKRSGQLVTQAVSSEPCLFFRCCFFPQLLGFTLASFWGFGAQNFVPGGALQQEELFKVLGRDVRFLRHCSLAHGVVYRAWRALFVGSRLLVGEVQGSPVTTLGNLGRLLPYTVHDLFGIMSACTGEDGCWGEGGGGSVLICCFP